MSVYKLSKESESDIANIYEYGIKKFGIQQAQTYLVGMHDLLQTLAQNPLIGRDASEFSNGLKRFTYKAHMVFYLRSNQYILVIRVLHQSMDYQRYF